MQSWKKIKLVLSLSSKLREDGIQFRKTKPGRGRLGAAGRGVTTSDKWEMFKK